MYKGRQDIDGKTGASLGHLVPSKRVPPLCPMTSAARQPARPCPTARGIDSRDEPSGGEIYTQEDM